MCIRDRVTVVEVARDLSLGPVPPVPLTRPDRELHTCIVLPLPGGPGPAQLRRGYARLERLLVHDHRSKMREHLASRILAVAHNSLSGHSIFLRIYGLR